MNKIAIIVALAVAICASISFAAPSPPYISENFSADLHLTVQSRSTNSTQLGTGYVGSDYHAGRLVERGHFEYDHHPLNYHRLDRFDLHRSYEVMDNTRCVIHPLEGRMPEFWAWLKYPHTTYSREIINGQSYDTWSIKEGYSHVTLAVDANHNPAYLIRQIPELNITARFTNFNRTSPSASAFDIPSKCHGQQIPAAIQQDESALVGKGCVSRSLMIQRAAQWVADRVPYNQGGLHDGYREDCSGYVSMAWGTSKPGYVTSTLHEVSHPISKGELMPGDVLLCAAEHVVLFGGWADSSQTHYTAYEETRPGEGTVKRVTPYPYWYNTGCFKPYRYNAVC